MKKNLYMLLFAAVALFSAATITSCSKDDPEPDPKPEPVPAENYVKYTAKMSEDIFAYFDVSVIIEADGKQEVFKFGEETKVSDIKLGMEVEGVSKAGRILEIPPYKFNVHPVRIITDMKLSEAGKEKIAKATPEDKMDFIVSLNFGECNKTGAYTYNNPVNEFVIQGGTYVNELETAFKVFLDGHKNYLDRTFK